ncbi:MAG TPA: HTH domain-containing protein, partial [Spirochaetota bacterium]|nr:HTH domain-containing protein [Spirochaetota bacterium]
MKLDRLLSIIVILLNRDRVSAKELAERFEVTVRTIYRDIDAINLSGIPIISYSGNNGGFGILENFKLDKHYLSMEEMTSILSALKGINKTLEDKTIDTTIEKIRSLVPESAKSDNYLSLNETIAIDILPWGATENIKEKLKIIKKAANERKTLTIKYFSSSEETSERI